MEAAEAVVKHADVYGTNHRTIRLTVAEWNEIVGSLQASARFIRDAAETPEDPNAAESLRGDATKLDKLAGKIMEQVQSHG